MDRIIFGLSLECEVNEKSDASYNVRAENLRKLPQIMTRGFGQESLSVAGGIDEEMGRIGIWKRSMILLIFSF